MIPQSTRVAVYARFSSDRQRDASIADQERKCREHAARQEDWSIVRNFSDYAMSGMKEDRPGLQDMLLRVRAGEFDVVLAESLDRISRKDILTLRIFDLCQFVGVRIETVEGGEVNRLQASFKGLMSADEIKLISSRTLRGLQGRVLGGRCVGPPPYGYRLVRRLNQEGEPERGLWETVPGEVEIIRRVFGLYADGASPRAIAKLLNKEGVPSPDGGIWYDSSIRGQAGRGDGLLRRQTYRVYVTWGLQKRVRHPDTGRPVRHPQAAQEVVGREFPGLRIIEDDLWEKAQDRLEALALPRQPNHAGAPGAFWAKRRPKRLLSGKVFCSTCGRGFRMLGKDYLGCEAARHGGCHNTKTIRCASLESQVMRDIGGQLMDPALVAVCIAAFNAELKTLTETLHGEAKAAQRELKTVRGQIKTLVDNLTEVRGSNSMFTKLKALEVQERALEAKACKVQKLNLPPALHPGNASIYAAKVNALHEALRDTDNTAALEAARALIDRVVIHPPETDGDPPGIEVIGELEELLKASGITVPSNKGATTPDDAVLDLFARSIKDGPGARPLAGPGSARSCWPLHECPVTSLISNMATRGLRDNASGSLQSGRIMSTAEPLPPGRVVRARAPLRLGLAGGGTDLSPYCDEHGGAVLNCTIDRYAFCFIETSADGLVHFTARDLSVSEAMAPEPSALAGAALRIHAGVYRRMMRDFAGGRMLPLRVTTFVDAPAGSGLGSSSALCVAMVEAYRELLGLPLGLYDVAHLAFEIERIDLALAGGKQDQYAAAFGGANFIEFLANDRVVVNPLRVSRAVLCEFETSLVTCFTGVSRRSDAIINEQQRRMTGPSADSLDSLHQLKADAVEMKQALLRGEIRHMGEILNRSWEAKKRTARGVSTELIDNLYDTAMGHGALAGKVSGAGGGGFMMFIVPPEARMDLIAALNATGANASAVQFTNQGAESWRAVSV